MRARLAASCAVALVMAATILSPANAAAKPAITTCGMYHHSVYDTWWPSAGFATVKPGKVTYECGSGLWAASKLKWKTYKAKKAVAKAKVRWHNDWDNYPEMRFKTTRGVRFTFTRPRTMTQNYRPIKVFTRLKVHHPKLGKQPSGKFKLKISGPNEGGSCDLGFNRKAPFNSSICPRITVP